MHSASLIWITALLYAATPTAAEGQWTAFFDDEPLTIGIDEDALLLRDAGVEGDIADMVAKEISASLSDFSNNKWRRALQATGKQPVVDVPPLGGKARGMIVPFVVGSKLKGQAGIETEPVYRVKNGEVRLLLGTVTAKFYEDPTQELVGSIVEDLCSHEQICLKAEQLESDLVRFTMIGSGLNPFLIASKLRDRGKDKVQWAEADFALQVELFGAKIPTDTHFDKQWYLIDIQAPQAWDLATGTDRIIIAIIDDGLDVSHQDLRGKIVEGWDFILRQSIRAGEAQPDEQKGFHGTAVAGIAAAATDNKSGVAGVAWNARIMPLRVMNSSKDGTSFASASALADAILWAHKEGARVINISWGGVRADQVLHAIRKVTNAGSLVVCAVGNSGTEVAFPARVPECLAVGAVDRSQRRWKYSNYGPKRGDVDIMAPSGEIRLGGDIWTTDSAGKFGYTGIEEPQQVDKSGDYVSSFGGTSAAAPIIAGAAALIWSEFPILGADDVRDAILDNAVRPQEPIPRAKEYGEGWLNLKGSLEAARKQWEHLVEQDDYRELARLEAAFWPRSQSWKERDGVRKLLPALENVVVLVAKGEIPSWNSILKTGAELPAKSIFSGDTIDAYLVPRKHLQSEEELKSQAKALRLPTIYSTYADENKALVIPLGIVSLEPSDEEALLEILRYAGANNLKVLERKNETTTRLLVLKASKAVDVFQVIKDLHSRQLVKWATLDVVHPDK